MKRDEAVIKLRAARKELLESLYDVSDEDMLRPNAVEKWSLKDLLGHIAAWDEETLRVIQAFAMQTEPQYSYAISERNDFGTWNEEQFQIRQDHSLEQVRHEFEGARRDLIQVIEGVTDQVLMRPKRTSWNTTQTGLELLDEAAAHDLEHAMDVRRWRKKRERWARARQKYVSKRRETKKKPDAPEEPEEHAEG
jgi:uncharacterized damage-inducible protein DinB